MGNNKSPIYFDALVGVSYVINRDMLGWPHMNEGWRAVSCVSAVVLNLSIS